MASDLVSGALAQRVLTFFGLGGSGIRVVEALLHLCAFGLGPRKLKIVLIDPDQGNAAVTRVRRILKLYQDARFELVNAGSVPDTGYFRTEVVDVLGNRLVWSPIEDEDQAPNARFSARIDEPLMQAEGTQQLGHLADLLFPERVRQMDLGLGFRGIPAIGTVFMNRLRDEMFFRQLLTEARVEDAVFFATGSIFGGTGASALPVIGRSVTEGVRGIDGGADVAGIKRHRVGAALLLPYFTLPAPPQHTAEDGGVRPETALFAQNAAGALPSYVGDQTAFAGLYVIGDSEPREQERNSVGGAEQDNRAHYVELFAALAALDFASRGGERQTELLPAFYMTTVSQRNPSWFDLPLGDGSRQRLIGAFVAAHTVLSIFRPNGDSLPDLDSRLRGVTWLELLGLRGRDIRARSSLFDALARFYRNSWDWASQLRGSSPALELVRANGGRPADIPMDAVIDGLRSATRRPRTTREGWEIFRSWNTVAPPHKGAGWKGFLEVMRDGSEAFARDRFSEAINVQAHS